MLSRHNRNGYFFDSKYMVVKQHAFRQMYTSFHVTAEIYYDRSGELFPESYAGLFPNNSPRLFVHLQLVAVNWPPRTTCPTTNQEVHDDISGHRWMHIMWRSWTKSGSFDRWSRL